MTEPSLPAWQNPAFVAVRCFACEELHDLHAALTVCHKCGLPLRVDYDHARAPLAPAALVGRPASLWRYHEVLPIKPAHAVTLTEGFTPLLPIGDRLFVKDESRNPTGSFKARGLVMAVSMARVLGAKALSAPSAGNAAGALAAYGAAAKIPVVVAMPEDTPRAFIDECKHYGAEVHLRPGTIADAGKWLREHGPRDTFDVSTLKEPYRIEGKKTMAYELYEQFAGELPDVIVYPTGGGTGLVGMWKAFSEMRALGWPMPKLPRLVSVQMAGCAPVVRGYTEGAQMTVAWQDAQTKAWGLRVPSPIGGFLCLRAVRETHGTAIAVAEADMNTATSRLAARTGIDICPEGGATFAAYEALRAQGVISDRETVVLFNTGTGLKYR
ncbi:MAG TPA: threonine synthase [Kofleriaceae bacterium]|nr:threonine synthase [Kofleriaceae bacterium]